jgi:hypothetical protein
MAGGLITMFTLTQLAAAVRRGSESGVSCVQGMVGWRPEGVPKPIKPYVYYPALENNFYHNFQDPLKSLSDFDFYVEFYAGTLDVDSVQRIVYTANTSNEDYVEVFYISINANGETCLRRYDRSSSIPKIIYNFGVQKKCKFKITEIDGLINIFNVDNDGGEIFIYESLRYTGVNKYCFINFSYNTQPYFITDFYKFDKNTGEKIQIKFDNNDPHFEWTNYIEPDTFEYNPYTQQWESQTTTITIPEQIDLFTSNGDIANKPSIFCYKTSYALSQYGEFKNIDLTQDFEIEFNNVDTLYKSIQFLRIFTESSSKNFMIQYVSSSDTLSYNISAAPNQSVFHTFKILNDDLTYADFKPNAYIDSFIIKKVGNIITFTCNGLTLYLSHYDIDASEYIYLDHLDITNMNPTKNSGGEYYDATSLFSGQYTLKTLYQSTTVSENYIFVDKLTVRQFGNTYESYIGRTGELTKVDQLGNQFIEFINMTPDDVIEFKNIPYTNVYENVDKKEFIKIDIE